MTKNNEQTTPEKSAKNFLVKMKPSLFGYAVKNYNHDAFLKSAMLGIIESEVLTQCLQTEAGQASLFNAMRYAATTGLSLNPQEGKAWLIGYKKKDGSMIVDYQIGKNGLIELAMQSGLIESIDSFTVRENDVFESEKRPDTDNYRFSPARKDRGDIDGFFVAVIFKTKQIRTDYMTIQEIEAHRDKYARGLYWPDGNKKEDHAWNKSFEGMGLKTVIKRIFRNLKISNEMTEAVTIDDKFEGMTYELEKEKGFTADDVKEKMNQKTKEPEIIPPEKTEVKKDGKELF